MIIKLSKSKDGLIDYKCYREENSKRYLVQSGTTVSEEIYNKLLNILKESDYVYDVNASKGRFFLGKYEESNGCVVGDFEYTFLLDDKLSNDMYFAGLLNKLVMYYIDCASKYNEKISTIRNNKKNMLNVCNGVSDFVSGHTASIDKEYARELRCFIDANKFKILDSEYWRSEDVKNSEKTKKSKLWFIISTFVTCLIPPILLIGGLTNIPLAIVSFLFLGTSTMLIKDKYVISEYHDNKKALEDFRAYLDTCDDGFESLHMSKKVDSSDFTEQRVKAVKKVDFEPLNLEEDSLKNVDLDLVEDNNVEFEDIQRLIYKP